MLNMFADPQNISLLGVVRKISRNPDYSDMWLIIPGLIFILHSIFKDLAI